MYYLSGAYFASIIPYALIIHVDILTRLVGREGGKEAEREGGEGGEGGREGGDSMCDVVC